MTRSGDNRRISMVVLFLALTTPIIGSDTRSQTSLAREDDCKCIAAFDNLVSKIEADYVGYHLAIKGKRDAEYRRNVEAIGARARRTPPESCIFVLQNFLRFFRDGHLFVGNSPRLNRDEVEYLNRTARRVARSENEVRRYLDISGGRLDPLEGIWYAKEGYRVAITRNPGRGRGEFLALMLSDDLPGWIRGQVKAQFRRLRDGSYDVVFYDKNHSPRYPNVYLRGQLGGAALRRGLLLHMPPITWGKAYPLRPNERGLLDPVDPRRPTIRAVDESTVVVSVPSHSPEYTALLESLIEEFHDRILRANNLLIDIRGDEGGSAGMTRALMPFLVTKDKRSSPADAGTHAVVLSSPDNIRYFEQMHSQGWVPLRLVERMRANPGKVISFDDPDSRSDVAPAADSATPLPRNVAILIDGAVVSAGEAFVLNAMKNKKVILFGENTGGVIDYQSVTIIDLSNCPALGLYLGYPTSAASDQLPAGGINATGIPPDIRIWRAIKDPIRYVIEYYAQRERQ